MSRSSGPSLALRIAKACKPNTIIKALSGAAVVWAFLPEDDSVATSIHQAFREETWTEGGWPQTVVLWTGFAFWFPAVLLLVARGTINCGARVKQSTGLSLTQQVLQQLRLALRYAVAPPWYYMFELHDEGRRRRALEYLYRFETKAGLYDLLRHYLSSAETSNALSDKAEFALRCRRHAVSAISALATVDASGITRFDGGPEGELPRRDLFLKPVRGAGGRGAERWLWRGDGTWQDPDGASLDEPGLSSYLRELGAKMPYVVRAFVRNHPEVAELSPGALSTVRVVTCLDQAGRAEVTHAVLRMARDESVIVDNFHAGGLASPVNIATGVLGQASDMGLRSDSSWHDVHPATHARITGRRLPMWPEVVDLVCRAHQAFGDQCAIGWDVAILDDGPSLVEGNKSPDLDIIQRIYREPLGNSRFGELFLHHVGRALDIKHGLAPAAAAASGTGTRTPGEPQ